MGNNVWLTNKTKGSFKVEQVDINQLRIAGIKKWIENGDLH